MLSPLGPLIISQVSSNFDHLVLMADDAIETDLIFVGFEIWMALEVQAHCVRPPSSALRLCPTVWEDPIHLLPSKLV